MDFSQYREFFAALEQFKFVERTMPVPDRWHENDAEHSWNLAMLVLTLAPAYSELDLGKCLQYALIHDLGELYAGDTYVYDEVWLETKTEREAESMGRLFALMPEETRTRYEKLWHDYEVKMDSESQFVYELDKIQPIILIVTLETEAWKTYKISKEKLLGAKLPKLSDRFELKKLLLEYVEEADKKGMFYCGD